MRRSSVAALFAWVLSVGMVAVVVHVSSIFLLPRVATRDSFARLAPVSAGGSGFQVLAADMRRITELPFIDLGTAIAVCRFDLEASPWRVRADADPEALTSLSFYTRTGTVFHTLTDRAALRGRLDVLLGTAAQIDAVEAADADETPSREVRLTAPSRTGTVVLRAMPSSPLGGEALRRRVNAAECRAAG